MANNIATIEFNGLDDGTVQVVMRGGTTELEVNKVFNSISEAYLNVSDNFKQAGVIMKMLEELGQ